MKKDKRYPIDLPCPICLVRNLEGENEDEICPKCKGLGTIRKRCTEAEIEELASNLVLGIDRNKLLEETEIITPRKKQSQCPFGYQ